MGKRAALTPHLSALIAADYALGDKVAAIAAKHRVSANSVIRCAKRAGIKLRGAGRPRLVKETTNNAR